jgi:microcystin-dependent protein
MEPFVGQIALFPIGYVPSNWAPCDGRLINITNNRTLYGLIGSAYGGNGTTTFAVPDLQGRAPVCYGVLAGGANYLIGQRDGMEAVALTEDTIPPHLHRMAATTDSGGANDPKGMLLAMAGGGLLAESVSGLIYNQNQPTSDAKLTTASVTSVGGSKAHNNMQPSLVLQYCIALVGIYPPRGAQRGAPAKP